MCFFQETKNHEGRKLFSFLVFHLLHSDKDTFKPNFSTFFLFVCVCVCVCVCVLRFCFIEFEEFAEHHMASSFFRTTNCIEIF